MGMMSQAAGGSGKPRGGGGGGRGFNLDDYIQVQDRINEFWVKYPEGSILTYLRSAEDNWGAARYLAEVRKDRTTSSPDATGWAFELAVGKGANSTSHEENCETSAIGRALANMGFAVSASKRASREEMEKVQRAQEAQQAPAQAAPSTEPMTDKQRPYIQSTWKQIGYVQPDGHHDAASLNTYTMQHWNTPFLELNAQQASEVLENLLLAKKQREEAQEHVTNDGEILEHAPF